MVSGRGSRGAKQPPPGGYLAGGRAGSEFPEIRLCYFLCCFLFFVSY